MVSYFMIVETPEQRSCFEQIYLTYKGLMFHVANSILHNEQDAEDTVHQAFVKIAENIHKIQTPVSGRTQSYVVTIAEHQAIDFWRAKKRMPDMENIEDQVGLYVAPPELNSVADCILKLPPRYRHIVFLKYTQGFTNAEIGKLLDITADNAAKLDQRARKKLFEICKEEGVL